MDVGSQFLGVMAHLDKLAYRPMTAMTKFVAAKAQQNAREGKTFPGEPFVHKYTSMRTIRDRRKLGLQVNRVDLQRIKKRINETFAASLPDGAYVGFKKIVHRNRTAGQIMFAHQHGLNTPRRTIFPNSHKTVPPEAIELAAKTVKEVFDGLRK